MTRSMMVLKLAEMLIESNIDDVEEAADDILRRLEKAGMIPPDQQWEQEYESH
jgi:hypothetical protein